jgi:glyceraldehyde-3-phosphate dehydrogenase (NADP+)
VARDRAIAGTGAATGGELYVRDPETGERFAAVRRATASDAKAALETAVGARPEAAALPSGERAAVLARAAVGVAADAASFAETLAREGVKTIREAEAEVARCVKTLELSAAAARRPAGELIPFDDEAKGALRLGFYVRRPAGVIVAITPFNDPLNLVAHKLGPALAAGNSVILKPDERTPLSALRLADVLAASGLPPGVLQVLVGEGAEVVPPLVSDARVRVVSFTGGRLVGKKVAEGAAGKRLVLELGGSCPTLVLEDADLEAATAGVLAGACAAAGQNCVHVQHVIAHERIYDELRDRLASAALELRQGPKLERSSDIGCLIDERASRRLAGMLAQALRSGARVLCGGPPRSTAMPLTILEGASPHCEVVRSEVFGPITVLSRYRSLEEGLARANDADGLQAGVFTASLETALTCLRSLGHGGVIVNATSDLRYDGMPFGGTGSAGLGREGVEHALLEYSEPQVACFA